MSEPPPPPPPHKAQTGCSRFVQVTFCCAFMMSTAGVDTATAAARRRQRRVHSWLRHERMTVAMTLAEMSHHTAPRGPKMARVGEEVEYEKHAGIRAQKTPPPGERPGILAEPGPQRSDRTVRRSSGETPLLAVPVLAGGDGVDGTALSFLVRRAVEDRRRRRRRRGRRRKLRRRRTWSSRRGTRGGRSTSPTRRRWRSDATRHPLRPSGRGRRGGRGGRLVPPLFLAALVVVNDSGSLAVPVLLVTMYLALCSLLASSGPRCFASWPVWSRRTAAVVWQSWYC